VSTHSIRSYKLAKIFVKDLDYLIKEVESSILKYNAYIKYKPVKRIINTLRDELEVLKAHKVNCDGIVNAKAEIKEE